MSVGGEYAHRPENLAKEGMKAVYFHAAGSFYNIFGNFSKNGGNPKKGIPIYVINGTDWQ